MLPNPEKFQSIMSSKNTQIHLKEKLNLHKVIESISEVKLLGIRIDDIQCAYQCYLQTYLSASLQLNALLRLKSFLEFEERVLFSLRRVTATDIS